MTSWKHVAETVTLLELDCLLGATPADQVSGIQIPPSLNKEKSTAKAQPLQHLISHLLAGVRLTSSLQAKEIHRQMAAQGSPCKFLVFKQTFHQLAQTAAHLYVQEQVQDILLPFLIIRRNYIGHAHADRTWCAMRPAKAQTSQTFVTQETLPRHIARRSLLMTGPAHVGALYVGALYVSVRLPEQTSGSSSGLRREPTILGILFGSAAHCPHGKHTFLYPLRLSKTNVPWPSCFLQIFNIWPHGATPCICNTWSPIPIPRQFGKLESSFTSVGIHPLSPTFVVPMGVRSAPPCLRCVSSSAPSWTTTSGKSVKFGIAAGLDSMFYSKSPTFTACVSTMMNLLNPSIILSRRFSGKPCTTMLTGLSPSFCWCQEFVRRDQVVTDSLWRRVCSKHFCFSAVRAVLYDQDSVRVLPIILAATCRTPPRAILLSVPQQMWPSSGYRWQRRQRYDSVTPPCR